MDATTPRSTWLPYEFLTEWSDGDSDPANKMELYIFYTGKTDYLGKDVLSYRFYDGPYMIFEGLDFACSPLNALDSPETVSALLSFLSLEERDTDAEYFEDYSKDQIEWRDERAENLANSLYDFQKTFDLEEFDEEEEDGEEDSPEDYRIGKMSGGLGHSGLSGNYDAKFKIWTDEELDALPAGTILISNKKLNKNLLTLKKVSSSPHIERWSHKWEDVFTGESITSRMIVSQFQDYKNLKFKIDASNLSGDHPTNDEEEFMPDEEDAYIQDSTRGGYDVAIAGKHLGNFVEYGEAERAIHEWMQDNNYFPNIWFVSDNGNVSLAGSNRPADFEQNFPAIIIPVLRRHEDLNLHKGYDRIILSRDLAPILGVNEDALLHYLTRNHADIALNETNMKKLAVAISAWMRSGKVKMAGNFQSSDPEELQRLLQGVALLTGHGSIYLSDPDDQDSVIIALVWDNSGFTPGAAISVETSGFSSEDEELQGAYEDLEEKVISDSPEHIKELQEEWGDDWNEILTEGWNGKVFNLPWDQAVRVLREDEDVMKYIEIDK